MKTSLELPFPQLSRGRFASFDALSDEKLFKETGVRIAFTERRGGVSEGAYESLNLGSHVSDVREHVEDNRRIVQKAFFVEEYPCIIPLQVHGSDVLVISEGSVHCIDDCQKRAETGIDAVLVEAPQISALLCFADCVPVIIVSPSGRFVVIHAGWRGVINEIAVTALKKLRELDADEVDSGAYNVYIGPYIHAECFVVGEEVCERFRDTFDTTCVTDQNHVDLGVALRHSLLREGVNEKRLVDADLCTVCNNDRFFSYRAQEGTCGRHGAFAVRA